MRGTRFTESTIPAGAAIGGIGAIVVSALIGRFAANHGRFSWEAFTGAATAAGTVTLAVYTAVLARATNRDVEVATRLAEQAANDARERERPRVFIQETDWGGGSGSTDGYNGRFWVTLRNAGVGPAVNVRLRPYLSVSDATLSHSPSPTVTIPTLASNEERRVNFTYTSRVGLHDDTGHTKITAAGSFFARLEEPESREEIRDVREDVSAPPLGWWHP
jgi:hypothetical protein